MNLNEFMVREQVQTEQETHFDPERGWVVSTSRSTPAQNLAVSCLHALRPVFDTAPLRQNENYGEHLAPAAGSRIAV